MRKALIVGIDYYLAAKPLRGCINDAHSVKAALERHADGTVNFSVRLLTGTSDTDSVSRTELKDAIRDLFSGDAETALLYFAGHGAIDVTGGYLVTSECTNIDDGVPLNDVLALANQSRARNKVIVLDSCHSGIAGASPNNRAMTAELSEGITILTASTDEQYADENNASGVFTSLFVDALNGSAANLVGEVTPGSIYAHIDQSLGPWEQRPVFKTNIKSFVSLRTVQPPIALSDLQRISTLFPQSGYEFQLDPSFEPTSDSHDANNAATFSVLQSYARVNLVVPLGAKHMYYAAMESRSCKLTVLGEHYRRLCADGRI